MAVLILTSCENRIIPDHWAAAKVAGRKVTFGEMRVFKQNRNEYISDKQALDLLIEREVLFEEAKTLNVTVSPEDVKQEVHRAKMDFVTSGSEEEEEMLHEQIKILGLSYDQYWDEYLPQSYAKLKTMVRMKKVIRDQIEESNNMSSEKMKKEYDKLYQEKIEELKQKYGVEYYLN